MSQPLGPFGKSVTALQNLAAAANQASIALPCLHTSKVDQETLLREVLLAKVDESIKGVLASGVTSADLNDLLDIIVQGKRHLEAASLVDQLTTCFHILAEHKPIEGNSKRDDFRTSSPTWPIHPTVFGTTSPLFRELRDHYVKIDLMPRSPQSS